MPQFKYLPGTQALTVDNGLTTRRVPSSKAVLIIGTAGQGPANDVYTVVDRATAAQVFGLSGTLVKALEEVALGGCDNITLFRIGAIGGSVTGVGVQVGSGATPGFAFNLGQNTADVGTRYKVWYKTGVLYVYLDGQPVYANDVTNSITIDTGDVTILGTIAGNTGLVLGTGTTGSLSGAITLNAIASLTGTTPTPLPIFVSPITGLGLTGQGTYMALVQALDLLSTFPTEVVYCPNAIIDQPNVAYYVSADATTAVNNPATNPNALDWFRTSTGGDGTKTYQWASAIVDSNGSSVPAMVAVTPAARVTAGFYEVHFPYLLAAFCQLQEQLGESGTCIAFLGTNPPLSYGLSDVRKWVGFLPTYDVTIANKPTSYGSGLLGIPLWAGTTAAKLNPLTGDYASGYRSGGMFLTAEGQYGGTIRQDTNGNNIDIGAYLHAFADYSIWSTGWAVNYVNNGAGYVAGYYSTLDPKVGLTNKQVRTIQLWKPTYPQADSLTRVGISVLRFQGTTTLPVLLNGETAATPLSDYSNLLRQSIKGMVIETIRQVANAFIGFGSLDGLQQQSLITALTKSFTNLQSKQYISAYNFAVTTTQADLRLGHGSIQVTFTPAEELVQLVATVGIG